MIKVKSRGSIENVPTYLVIKEDAECKTRLLFGFEVDWAEVYDNEAEYVSVTKSSLITFAKKILKELDSEK